MRASTSWSGSRTNRNRDEALTRNFLRLRVGPLLEERFPRWRESLARAARHFAAADAGASRALREFLAARGLRAPSEAKLAEMLKQLTAARRAHADRATTAGSCASIAARWRSRRPASRRRSRDALAGASGGWRCPRSAASCAFAARAAAVSPRRSSTAASSACACARWRAPAARSAAAAAQPEEPVPGGGRAAVAEGAPADAVLRRRTGVGAGTWRGCGLAGGWPCLRHRSRVARC